MRNIQYEDPYVTVKPPKKRTFVLSKVKDPLYLSSIKPKINQSFEDKDIFLDIKSPIIINKFPQGPKYDSNKKIIPFSYIGPITTINKSKKIKYDNSIVTSKPNKTNISFSISPCNIHQIQSSSSSVTLNGGNDTMKKKLDFEIVDDKILKNYYNDLKLLEKQNKSINNIKLLTNVPCSLRKKLLEQERKLTNKQNEENNIIKMSNLLCKRTKKNMKDLLIHQGDSFQFKSQAIRTLDTFKQSHGSFSSGTNWIHSLRYHNNKPKQNDIINKFINIRNTLNPLWIVDNDLNKSLSLKQHNEIKCKPRMLSNNIYRNYIKKPIMKSEMKKNFSMKKLESLKNIEINGINLLQLESENESKIPGKKKLYKQNQLDTINIKTANQNEFHREYTKMINEQIIAQDYF